jgi:hypothetical protein
MQAVVQTFHLDSDSTEHLAQGLDAALERFAQNPAFGGLLCLERPGGLRTQITVVVLWKDSDMSEFAPQVDEAHDRIATTTDLRVSSQYHHVLRYLPGSPVSQSLAHA